MRLFVLGAGFSVPSGAPLASELMERVLASLEGPFKKETHLHWSLEKYVQFIRETSSAGGPVDPEQFVEYLDHRHYLGLDGSDRWSEHGNLDQCLLRWGIGHVLHGLDPGSDEVYASFARLLRPGDHVLTLNYDLLLERSLDLVGTPYRRFPCRFKSVGIYQSIVDTEADASEVVIHKLHGSIDWIDRSIFDRQMKLHECGSDPSVAASLRTRDPIFGEAPICAVQQLVDGPRPQGDRLSDIVEIADVDAYYSSRTIATTHPPLLLAPSRSKLLYGSSISDLWYGLAKVTIAPPALNVIGYSLPQHDIYMRQVLWQLAKAYSVAADDPEYRPFNTERLTVVDYRDSTESELALHDTYKFFPAEHTDFLTDGFNVDSLEHLFPDEPYMLGFTDSASEEE